MNKLPISVKSLYFFETLVLDVDIVVVCDAVNTDYLDILYILKQTLNEIRSDKACCSSNENGLALKIYIILYHELITLKYVTSINLLNHIIEA